MTEGKKGRTYPHSALDDCDHVVRAILIETRVALLVVKDDDCDVD